jgi:hypothetical protein
LIEVIQSSGEEMWRVDAYQIPYYSRGIEGEKRTHPRFADWQNTVTRHWWMNGKNTVTSCTYCSLPQSIVHIFIQPLLFVYNSFLFKC